MRLRVHGANLDLQEHAFQRRDLASLLEATRTTASPSSAPTTRASCRELMAEVDWVVVPSIWWENSPLVIQEAFPTAGR